jgi:hypothetical protein
VHGSDSPESAAREIGLFFGKPKDLTPEKELLQTLEFAEIISAPIKCQGSEEKPCHIGVMDEDVKSPDICEPCRTHWLILEAKSAAQKLVKP